MDFDLGGVGIFTAFAAGLVSFLSPCVLPLVPGYLSAISGVSPAEIERADTSRILRPAVLFVASFSFVFILLGLPATAIGEALRENQDLLADISGWLMIAMGLIFVGSLFILRLNREWHIDALLRRAGTGGPVVAGAAFSIAWTPCIGPTLGAISGLAASEGNVLEAMTLLAIYSAGLAIPFLLTAVAFSRMTAAFAVIKRHFALITVIGGVILVGMGILILTGAVTDLNQWAQRVTGDLGLNL
ncbi:MAG TPA: cytochrome c biogenesis CcdA family protein [Solirubrobacterales bacterium]|nr:cytochrome c biogenesis CcdA family protein [Solirubrobacterales bacterium]